MTNNTVSGTVLDHQRKPLPGATVLIPGTTIGAVTDTRGSYSITVPNGASSRNSATSATYPERSESRAAR